MSFFWRRFAVCLSPRARVARRVFSASIFSAALSLSAHAVVVRGRLTDPLGKPVPGGRVQLVQNGKVAAIAYAGPDGRFEIRSAASGRFTLLGSGAGFLPFVGTDFYGGATDVLEKNVVLSARTIRQDVTVTATGLPTPLPQLTAPVTVIPAEAMERQAGVIDAMRQEPGVFLNQQGQYGAVTSLFVRGGPSDGNKVLVDGVPAEDVGGVFDYGTVASTGIESIEVYRGPNSALYGTDSQAAVVSVNTPRGATLKPLLTYSGDAGNLWTWRNEVTLSGTRRKLDYYGGFSRFDTSNAIPDDQFRLATTAVNLGYAISGNTSLRFTFRNGDSSEGVPGPFDLYARAQPNKESDQDLYSGLTLENRTGGGWHNLVRYGIARKREQEASYGVNATPETYPDPYNGGTYTGYFGDFVTVRGANGYTATDRAQIYPGTPYDQDSNRDELYYQSDYTFPKRIAVLFGFRYDSERGSYNEPSYAVFEKTQRTNFEYNLELQGDVKNRLFYSFGGSLEKNHLYGLAGEPRLGLAYAAVRPGSGWFHGTRLRLNVATGVQEPSLATEFYSLQDTLRRDGDPAEAAKFPPIGPERSRTLDLGLDQNIAAQKLVLKLGYFHNQFSHQIEYVDNYDLMQYFGINPVLDPSFYGAEVNTLAYLAEGAETELEWQPLPRLFVRGGYTYLETRVEKSFSSDMTALLNGYPNENPNIPGIVIGSTSPLVGARVFRRPPHTGFFSAAYTGQKWSAELQGALASRADDSTFLGGYSPSYGNTLLLPNRDLDFGYVKLDLGGTYQAQKHVAVFVQINNLLNNQHIGPIGYPGLPFTFRMGVKVRLGGD